MEFLGSISTRGQLFAWAFASFLLAATTSFAAMAADVPFRFEANSVIFEGVAKLENNHLSGDASNGPGRVHLDGDFSNGELTVQATGNFAPGACMGSNLVARGSANPAVGKLSIAMPTSATKNYGPSLTCTLFLDFSASDPIAAEEVNRGTIYLNGTGVPQDYAEAMRHFQKAADRGYAEAQYDLGLMYFRGQGRPEDDVQAHMWFNLAAAGGFAGAAQARAQAEQLMTPEQIAEAQKRSRDWKPTGL